MFWISWHVWVLQFIALIFSIKSYHVFLLIPWSGHCGSKSLCHLSVLCPRRCTFTNGRSEYRSSTLSPFLNIESKVIVIFGRRLVYNLTHSSKNFIVQHLWPFIHLILTYNYFNWPFSASFFFIFVFLTINSKCVHYNISEATYPPTEPQYLN